MLKITIEIHFLKNKKYDAIENSIIRSLSKKIIEIFVYLNYTTNL